MSVTDLSTTVAVPAGWYPDPVDVSGLRWWSGENWTEHTSAPQPPVVDHVDEAVIPEVERFSRDPQVSGQSWSVSDATIGVLERKDPYRERHVMSGIALVIALIGLFAFVAGQLFDLPDVIMYVVGAVPFSIAAFAVVVAIRTSHGLAVAVIAAVLCLFNVSMVAALSATEARDDVGSVLQDQQTQATFEQAVEDAVVQTTDTLDMPAKALFADCPAIPLPEIGTVFDCIVTLENGDSYLVHVTAKDGMGAMAMELVDEPMAPGTAPDVG